MKKIIFAFTLLTLLVVLVACGGTSNSSSTTSSSGDSGSAALGSASLSLEEELLIGTLKLEDTDLAVSSDQAAQLLPLWQALQALSTSDTTAPEETQAVVNQIKATMTSQQIDAITAMELTQQDVMSVMTEMGLAFNRSGASGTPDASSAQGFPGGGFPDAGSVPSGGFLESGTDPDAGGAGGRRFVTGGGQQLSQEQIATLQAGGGQTGGRLSNGIPQPLLKALIDLLDKKT